jgi:hypothetical protein
MWMEELTSADGSKDYIGGAFRGVPGGGAASCPTWEPFGSPPSLRTVRQMMTAIIASGAFDLVVMPTHAGTFRQMLLGLTTAKVLSDPDCSVLTSNHGPNVGPRALGHLGLLCAFGASKDSERVLRFAPQVAIDGRINLHIIHATHTADRDLPVQLGLEEQDQSHERKRAADRIADLQRTIGSQASDQIVAGPTKESLLEAM